MLIFSFPLVLAIKYKIFESWKPQIYFVSTNLLRNFIQVVSIRSRIGFRSSLKSIGAGEWVGEFRATDDFNILNASSIP